MRKAQNKKFKIDKIEAREILDSRGQPTVELKMASAKRRVLASVPSGTSIGKYESPVAEIYQALAEIKGLAKEACRKEFDSQSRFDEFLNQRSEFSNVTLPLSIAFSRLFAALPPGKKLPRLQVLAFEGGEHSHSSLKIQEFLFIAETVKEGQELYQRLKKGLEKEGIDTDTGLEGGFAPNDLTDERALELMTDLLPQKTELGLDFGGRYYERKKQNSPVVEKLIGRFNLKSIEDPFSEDDTENWKSFCRKFSSKLLVVADDLVATNPGRLKRVLPFGFNAVIVKPNQIGTVSETLDFVKLARQNNLSVIVSHRSGETNDSFVAELALAIGADYVKFGGFRGGERMAKYNRLAEFAD